MFWIQAEESREPRFQLYKRIAVRDQRNNKSNQSTGREMNSPGRRSYSELAEIFRNLSQRRRAFHDTKEERVRREK